MKQKTSRGHDHAEAFCLMAYECRACFHREVIWNSRDGVTPFGMGCPVCGGDMVHVNWEGDIYAPEYIPKPGQGVWIGFPPELRRPMAAARIQAGVGTPFEVPAEHRADFLQALMGSQEFSPAAPFLIRWPGKAEDEGGGP